MKIGLLGSPEGFSESFINACIELKVDYEIVNLLNDEWVDEFTKKKCDGYVLRPAAWMKVWRNTYFKRTFMISKYINKICIPTIENISFYESKISMADYCQLHKLPYSKTKVFFSFRDAWNYAKVVDLPVIVKSDGGNSGFGIIKIKNRSSLFLHILESFFTNYTFNGIHSVFDMGKSLQKSLKPYWWFFKNNYNYFLKNEICHGYTIIQENINIATEWRIVVIGKSFFGHQKLIGKNGLHSGSGRVGWTSPPFSLLDQIRDWCIQLNINSMAFDIFEDINGNYYINEMQAVFGAYAPSQMYINNIPGRYIYRDGQWIFEEGEFCRYSCQLLRIQTLLEQINNGIDR